MSCCCQKIYPFCKKVSVCGNFNTGIAAPATGIYTLVLEFLGVTLRVEAEIAEDADIIFSLQNLNENYKYKAYIEDPTGEKLSFVIGEVTYDCLSFETNIQYQMTGIPLNEVIEDDVLFKDYLALLSQVGLNDPTATVLKNTVGAITFTRVSESNYLATSPGLFTAGKTWYVMGNNSDEQSVIVFNMHWIDDSNISIYSPTGDSSINDVPIQIRVLK